MITTARLALRPFLEDDRAAFIGLVSDPEVAGDERRVIPREDGGALFEFYQACWAEDGVAYAAIERRSDRAFLGMAGLALCPPDPPAPPVYEIGWALLPRFWGQGYAIEAADGWLAHGFEAMDLSRIMALTWTGNHRSLRLIARLGFHLQPDFSHPDGEPAGERLAFALTGPGWRARSAAASPARSAPVLERAPARG